MGHATDGHRDLAQDVNAANETASISLVATGLPTRTVAVAVTDDDAQAITATLDPLTITEGSNGTLDVRLAYQPAEDVTVATSSLNPACAALAAPSTSSVSAAAATSRIGAGVRRPV